MKKAISNTVNWFKRRSQNVVKQSGDLLKRANDSHIMKNTVKGARNTASQITDATGILYGRSNLMRMQKRNIFSSPRSLKTQLLVGSTGMAALAMMNGGMSKAHEIVTQKYMIDQKYAGRMMMQSNLGKASGNSPLNVGNHVGLSLSLSRARHGR